MDLGRVLAQYDVEVRARLKRDRDLKSGEQVVSSV